MGDYTEPSTVATGRPANHERLSSRASLRKLEIPLVLLTLLAGAAFLTKMCYLSLVFNSLFVVAFLALFYFYVRSRLSIRIPMGELLGLVFLALQSMRWETSSPCTAVSLVQCSTKSSRT